MVERSAMLSSDQMPRPHHPHRHVHFNKLVRPQLVRSDSLRHYLSIKTSLNSPPAPTSTPPPNRFKLDRSDSGYESISSLDLTPTPSPVDPRKSHRREQHGRNYRSKSRENMPRIQEEEGCFAYRLSVTGADLL